MVLDGSGAPARRSDVGGSGDRISAVGDLSRFEAALNFDASALVVCPGFIDAHSHSDAYLLIESSAPSKIFQGITTEIVGNCGASAAPLSSVDQLPSDWAECAFPGSWRNVAEYIALLERQAPAPNVVVLVGHARLRGRVMGGAARPPTQDELDAMSRLLEESLDQGGRGLSAGLIYAPGTYSTEDELKTLARVVARHDGIYTCHMRSEGRRLLEAISESIAIGRDTGARVQISHLKTAGRANWPLADRAIMLIRDAIEKEGLPVAADRYPYTSSCTDLDIVFPAWAGEGGRRAALARLRDPGTRSRIRTEIEAERDARYWASVVIGSTSHPDNKPFRGKPLSDVAAALGVDPVEAVLILTDRDGLKTSAFFSGMSEENMWKILAEPFVMLGTDASLRSTTGPLSRDYPHPRAYGSMPRFLRAALDGKTVPPEEAIRKMTSLPAEQFGLDKRGRIEKGYYADIIAFNPKTLRDESTYDDPHRLASGIELVMVNGVLTLNSSGFTGRRAGRVLR